MRIIPTNPDSKDALLLLDELAEDFTKKTGLQRNNSPVMPDAESPRAIFLVAYDEENNPLGCGALRPVDDNTCEIKRMYVRAKGAKVGSKILSALEIHAVNFGYQWIWIGTGTENQLAVKFYLRHGYVVRENYGTYEGRSNCICFEKPVKEGNAEWLV